MPASDVNVALCRFRPLNVKRNKRTSCSIFILRQMTHAPETGARNCLQKPAFFLLPVPGTGSWRVCHTGLNSSSQIRKNANRTVFIQNEIDINADLTNDIDNTKTEIASSEIVVDACDSHPDGGGADGQHTPVGGKHEPDGIVMTIESATFVQDVGNDPGYHEQCDDHPIHGVSRRHSSRCPLTKHKHLYLYHN